MGGTDSSATPAPQPSTDDQGKRQGVKRPAGVSALIFFLLLLGLSGLGLTFSQQFAGPGPVERALSLLYAATALGTAVGLWKLRPWSYTAARLWAIAVVAMAAWQVKMGFFGDTLPGKIAYVGFGAVVAVLVTVYVKRQVSPGVPGQRIPGSADPE